MEWHILVAAVATGTSLHTVIEPGGLFMKLRRYENAVNTGKIDSLPLKGIDTRPKAYTAGIVLTLFLCTLAYLVINVIDPSVNSALRYTVAVLLLGEFILIVRLDAWHVLIEKMTKAQKRKK